MNAVEAPPTAGVGVAAVRNRPPRHRRGRRGGAAGNATVTAQPANPALALRPASIAPEPASAPAPNANRGGSNRGRRGGPGRGARRGGAQPMVNGQRAFGGQLTSSTPEPSLAGDAPVFIPGQAIAPRAHNHHHHPPAPRLRPRRMSKSQAPDIATRTHEDITNAHYECAICTNEVLPSSKIWSCKTCWSVLHLHCVKKWAKNETSTQQQRANENGELPPPRQWRCPGCNLPKDELPASYTCWCAKETEPRSVPGLPPHSCGQTCSKPRIGQCPHPCEMICHAGPCPPCGHMGPSMSCFCGKEAATRRCQDTNYDGGWSCGQVCDDVLPCGEHNCQRGCHEGVCGSCEVLIESRCYCGREEKAVMCSERDEERESQSEGESWVGSFDCGVECNRAYDCENEEHFCEKTCHVQDREPAHCPYSPDVVTDCPCGKTPLSTLLDEPRKDCSAPIPHCKQKCENLLQCGHFCQQTCHEGECRPCLQSVEITCRCGRTTSKTICHQGLDEPPSCMRVCRATLNCGRHECGERCCPGEKKASERQASKRKHRPLNAAPRSDDNVEAEHICVKVCGRPLKCGNHTCQELCHKGTCSSCLEAVFDEISCACGRTTLHPPQPCGTRPPSCNFDCTRPQTCGHPQVKHTCHEDNESCPKCPFLVEKPCICGKKTLKNQPCWHTEVRCGLPCNKKLKCGIHLCQKPCHRPGQCEDAFTPCTQPCNRQKTVCEHACSSPCHAPYPCKEVMPCPAKTIVTCACQNLKQPLKCLASKTSPGNTGKVLDCTDDCLKLARNAALAAALNIDPATHTDDHIPYSTTTLSLFTASPKFAQAQEREFRVFAADEKEKRLRFKPMPAPQRAFIHALAEDFGLDSESQDPEPHRHVCIFKTPRFVSAPMKTLSQCVKAKAAPVPAVSVAAPELRVKEPFNAVLLSNPRFGLTIDELHAALVSDFAGVGFEKFDIAFLPLGDIIVRPRPSHFMPSQKLEQALTSLSPSVSKIIKALNLAASSSLCTVDGNLNVTRRDDDTRDGWSQVAKGAGRKIAVVEKGVGSKSSFTVLGAKKKEKKEEAVDDWEREVEGWGD